MTGRRHWSPYITACAHGGFGGNLPQPGQLIAYMDRRAWRVIEVADRNQANWQEQTVAAWRSAGEPDWETWDGRERLVLAEPARDAKPNGKDRRGLPLYPWAYQAQWWPLPDPYPACVECGLLWPCPCDDRNKEAAEALKELERLGNIMPGCCWACGNPITDRHRSIVFDGENLLLPGAGPAVFHAAHSRKAAPRWGTCRGWAEKYEEQWVAAQPGRKVRLQCPGAMWLHRDGSECSAGDQCPGGMASHAYRNHCAVGVGEYDHASGVVVKLAPSVYCGFPGCQGPKSPEAAAGSPT